MKNIFQDLRRKDHKRYLGGLDVFKYIGPGLLVTVGFIDPGNWASNFAAGSEFGYSGNDSQVSNVVLKDNQHDSRQGNHPKQGIAEFGGGH